MYELIVTEKPASAKKVAEALTDSKPIRKGDKGVYYYELTHNGKDIVVACAVGHLFGLAEKQKSGFRFPVFDIHWVPLHETSKTSAFSKKYLDNLKKLAKDADGVTVACDYDVEGEVIGLNVVRYVCKKSDAKRMKFSTLTKPDLVKAYEDASAHLDWGQAEAGETRHYLDYYYGINLSRALTSAIKKAGMFKILSTGRVQGPALKIITDREKEIKAFKPVPFWQLQLIGDAKGGPIDAWHQTDKFWEQDTAKGIHERVKASTKGKVSDTTSERFSQKPPTPFDLTTLQSEAYRLFGIKPKHTLDIAQQLYTSGVISYPRTSSQQLPESIGYAQIITALSKQDEYESLAKALLKVQPLTPNNGKKTDPAHPAIYPTGIAPKGLEGRDAKVYDLVVKRFFATFCQAAVRETMTASIEVEGEIFVAKGTRTVDPQWHVFYVPYVKLEELELPHVTKGEMVTVSAIHLHARETQPPKRFSPSSIVRELEKRNLGTKATRAEILETLYSRDYIKGEAIEATDFGMHLIAVLEKYCPKIVDEALTSHFEMDMESIRERSKKQDKVLEEAKDVILGILDEFKAKEKDIGEGLKTTFVETRTALETLGPCPLCKSGNIVLRTGKFGRFAACNKYPECSATFNLPKTGKIDMTQKICEHCQHPVIRMIRKAKRPMDVCINPNCPSKVSHIPDISGRKCPKCKEGDLVLRKSIYGAFIACGRFPKCYYTERIPAPDEPAKPPAAADPEKKPAAKKAAKKKPASKKDLKSS